MKLGTYFIFTFSTSGREPFRRLFYVIGFTFGDKSFVNDRPIFYLLVKKSGVLKSFSYSAALPEYCQTFL